MATTLGTMVDNVDVKLSDTNQGTPIFAFFSQGEIKKAIGDAYRWYVMKLVQLAEGYFEVTTDLDLVGGQEYVDISGLNPPLWRDSHLSRYVTNGFVPLQKSEDRFVPTFTIGVGTGDAYRPRYRRRSMTLVFNPPPIANETAALKFDYVYLPTIPNSTSADSFTFDNNFPAIYESNVEIRAAIKLLESKDAIGGVSDIQTFRDELADLDKAFTDTSETDEYPEEIQYMGINYNNGGM